MTASLTEITIRDGITNLKCPITGIDVVVVEKGFDSDAEHSPHLRFFIDWIGEIYFADPADLPPDQALYQHKLVAIFTNESEEIDQNTLVDKCLEVLPKSALVLEILNPPGGSYDGDIFYACFDLGSPALSPRIRLRSS